MLAFRIAGTLTFDGAKIITFFKTINRIFATHDITGNQERKQWVLNYSFPSVAWNLERVNHYWQLSYSDFCSAACKEYQS